MRRSVMLVAGALLAVRPAAADPKAPATPAPGTIDIAPFRASLVVYQDKVGKIYVVGRDASQTIDDNPILFYGDDQHLYQQVVIGAGVDSDTIDLSLWAPRVVGQRFGFFTFHTADASATVACKNQKEEKLTAVPADVAAKILGKATFAPPFWQRTAQFLARDDKGTYYYVDRQDDDHGGKGHRVFVGPKGAMKELPLTNVVHDSKGEIYATKRGELRLVTDTDQKASWKKGRTSTDLVVLEPGDNRYLIYRELGVYGQLGTICEDQ